MVRASISKRIPNLDGFFQDSKMRSNISGNISQIEQYADSDEEEERMAMIMEQVGKKYH